MDEAQATPAPAAPGILIVDDEPEIGKALSRFLRRQGFQVEAAGSAVEALEVFARTAPSIVISDYRLPGVDGATLLAEVRRLRPEVGRVLLSGYLGSTTPAEASAVAHGVFTKPWDSEALLKTLRELLERR